MRPILLGLESESVKKNSDSFRFRFLPTYIEGIIIAFRFKNVSDATLFEHSHANNFILR